MDGIDSALARFGAVTAPPPGGSAYAAAGSPSRPPPTPPAAFAGGAVLRPEVVSLGLDDGDLDEAPEPFDMFAAARAADLSAQAGATGYADGAERPFDSALGSALATAMYARGGGEDGGGDQGAADTPPAATGPPPAAFPAPLAPQQHAARLETQAEGVHGL